MQKIGLITIGQTPIPNIDNDINHFFSNNQIDQYGALDGLTELEIQNIHAQPNEHILTTELSDGSFVKLSKKKIITLLQKTIIKSEQNGNIINIILCTSLFPNFNYSGVLIEPGKLQTKVISFLSKKAKICVFIPTENHIDQVKKKWKQKDRDVDVKILNPSTYKEIEIINMKTELVKYNTIILDCAAYNLELTELLKKHFKGLILCPLSLSFNLISGLTQ